MRYPARLNTVSQRFVNQLLIACSFQEEKSSSGLKYLS
ncbi:hypothetical protein NBRC3257_0014 [Gluconobacter thailandicus NBRC 3257]|uniref:Transposase n=1 Tax=Gluconobacter thailandicus NBRC 3257 TaxID=1381097 RepID=A0ABQ0IS25_GLUTH|nr:hypothetical protein NBRC3257_0014 [Gluconobacter thailandicus NBRC 3257]